MILCRTLGSKRHAPDWNLTTRGIKLDGTFDSGQADASPCCRYATQQTPAKKKRGLFCGVLKFSRLPCSGDEPGTIAISAVLQTVLGKTSRAFALSVPSFPPGRQATRRETRSRG